MQVILIAVVFALAGWPVWRLTRTDAADADAGPGAATPAADVATAKTAPLDVEAVFAPAPADFRVECLGQTVLEGRGPLARFTTRWTAAVPAEGVDLVVQAHWPAVVSGDERPAGASSPAAARVTVRFSDGRQVEKSFWAGSSLTEVFTVPGAPAATPAP